MKLRIRGNSIRLRLTRSEVDRFAADGRVEESVHFGMGKPDFRYVLESLPGTATGAYAEFTNNTILVFVPEEQAGIWVATDQVGIESSEGSVPRVLIEKDFACLKERPGETEDDAFPNPDPDDCNPD